MHRACVQIWASGQWRISGYVLKSNVNKIKSRTAKFENKKSELAEESRGKVRLVEKFSFLFSFKRLHQGVWCLYQQQNMTEFQAPSRSTRTIFSHVVLLVALLWLCGSSAEKCEKADKSSRKCAGKKYFLSQDLARAAQLQVRSTVCRVHWDEIRSSNDRCSVPREDHSNKQFQDQ